MSLLRKALASLDAAQRRALLESHLGERVSRSLGRSLTPEELGLPLSAIGLDSLMAVELQHAIELDLDVLVPMASVLQAESLSALATELAGWVSAVPDPEALDAIAGSPTGAALGAGATTSRARIEPASRDGSLPLSFAQERLWFLDQLEGASATYNISAALRFSGSLYVGALRQALTEIVRRHESLRTTFPMVDHEPVQEISPAAPMPLPVVEIGSLAAQARGAVLERLADHEARHPFALGRDRLVRARVVSLSDSDHVLLVTMHHIVSDGWSMGVFLQELTDLYGRYVRGTPSSLPELRVQYGDFSQWQRGWFGEEALAHEVDYWKRRLTGAPVLHRLPTDRPRPEVQSFRGRTIRFDLGEELTEGVKELSRRARTTPYMTLQAAFSALLSRYGGERDIVLGCPIANRNRADVESLIGFFANTQVIRTDLSDDPTFLDLLDRVRETNLEAFSHQDVPFEHLVEALDAPRSLSHAPLFQVMFVFQPAAPENLELPGSTASGLKLDSGTAKFDLLLAMEESEGGFRGALEYSTDLFDDESIERMKDSFRALLDVVVSTPERLITSLPGEAEGYEVDPVKVRLALLEAASVEECVVVDRVDEKGQRPLVAYVVGSSVTPEELRGHLLARVQGHMVPISFVLLNRLPLTPGGDVDREALLGLEVIDDLLVRRWEDRLTELREIERAAVVVAEAVGTTRALHLADLLPESELPGSAKPEPTVPEAAAGANGRRTDQSMMALADGGPLVIPDDAPTTLTEALIRTAERYPEKGLHYIGADGSEAFQTYPELLADARRVLTGLRAVGLQPGDTVIIQIQELSDHFPVFWGCTLGGMVPVTVAVPPAYDEGSGVVSKLLNTWELLDHPRLVASDALAGPLEDLLLLVPGGRLDVSYVGELRAHAPAEVIHDVRPHDLAFYQLTSGSTGVPKCIQEVHKAIIAHIHGAQQFNGYSADDVSLNWLPMEHVVPILSCHLKDVYLGCQQVAVASSAVLADPLLWLDLIERYRVTHTWSPNFGFKLVNHALANGSERSWDLSSMKFFMNAGEQVTLPVVSEFLDLLAPFGVAPNAMQPAFGMAEVCTCMTYQNDFDVHDGLRRVVKTSLNDQIVIADESGPDTIDFVHLGPPVPGVQIRITDGENRLLPEGRIGRFQIKGDVVTIGYNNNEAANRDAFVGGGWFNTGDLGFILDGKLALTGREKEIIIVHGANYYCYEIEDVVHQVDGVEPGYVAAVGFEDPNTGTEALGIFFSPSVDSLEGSLHVVEAVRPRVAASLGISPALVVPIPKADFPKTTSGKIQRMKLKTALGDGAFDDVLKEIEVRSGGGGHPHDTRLVLPRSLASKERYRGDGRPGSGTVLGPARRRGVGRGAVRPSRARGRKMRSSGAGVGLRGSR